MRRQEFIKSIASLICLTQIPISSCTFQDDWKLNGNERILFLGDSITADGHYTSYIEQYLNSIFPYNSFFMFSLGSSSETISGLTEKDHPFPRPYLLDRIDQVLGSAKPDLVFSCYGMNCAIYHPYSESRFEKFEHGINTLIQKTHAAGAKLILLTPPPYTGIATLEQINDGKTADYSYMHPYPQYNSVLRKYADYLMGLESGRIKCIDLHKAMTPYIPLAYAADPIHPVPCGHYIMAMTILKGLGIQLRQEKVAEILDDELIQLKTEDELYWKIIKSI